MLIPDVRPLAPDELVVALVHYATIADEHAAHAAAPRDEPESYQDEKKKFSRKRKVGRELIPHLVAAGATSESAAVVTSAGRFWFDANFPVDVQRAAV